MKKQAVIFIIISLIAGFLIGYGYISTHINKMKVTIKELEERLTDKTTIILLLK